MSPIHSYKENYDFSQENQKDERWELTYRMFFPEFSDIETFSDDEHQNSGIDKIVYLKDGTHYNIDEKVDRIGYPRFPIEIWEDYYRGVPGWAVKEGMMTDHIAYLVLPTIDCYLIPYKKLRSLLEQNYKQWESDAKSRRNGFVYGTPKHRRNNRVGCTHIICVPFDFLVEIIPATQYRKWGQYDV